MSFPWRFSVSDQSLTSMVVSEKSQALRMILLYFGWDHEHIGKDNVGYVLLFEIVMRSKELTFLSPPSTTSRAFDISSSATHLCSVKSSSSTSVSIMMPYRKDNLSISW